MGYKSFTYKLKDERHFCLKSECVIKDFARGE